MNTESTRKIRLIMKLRNMGIKDTNVLSAIETTPRENFIPDAMKDKAYEDMALPIGLGQTISQPFVVAVMSEALCLSDRDKVLEVGTGSGYQAVILAKICRRLYTIERHKPLLAEAQKHFDALKINNITALAADGMKGWPQQKPFDKIIVTAAAFETPPDALFEQLKIGGIMIVPVGDRVNQVLKRYEKIDEDTYSVTDLLPVKFVPLLPNVASAQEQIEDTYQLNG
ncbi:MAG: protein-L-isoaspartate(D-aspartate) O-methyltransferase [Pseudomonadota bacterium]|nr:protein-L-isoaspartate O-methyltransferase [Alphaproteobacteria bacterium]MEC7577536.1 protein-L-isoaspartate(D-aspartate) O-methyltransferase [Pseudomonadota bacterium]MCS5597540.1 protein-L-isoaspartate(D-aspartate) O-methyltransferase [Alphaproteobacteria bacterium]MEC7702793.1 protein-L-isoaspartate(D-aspartate) O-methyltransferase [Pseudomonadota bacterium]MEC9236019.1 protein-L-isoaspartate(D-aspartate) O-methyltransferase [Pseudomonadota bacterium]|tara:strand:+ start:1590 stop:2270 length:681 start_codon:yes stop_codon:yes gene_type:complete